MKVDSVPPSSINKANSSPITRSRRSGGPRSVSGKMVCAQNGAGRKLRSVIDLLPALLPDSVETLYQSLLAEILPEGLLETGMVFALAQAHIELQNIVAYRSFIVDGQANQSIPFDRLTPILAASLNDEAMACLRRYQSALGGIENWIESDRDWAVAILDEVHNLKMDQGFWSACDDERKAERRFPNICRSLRSHATEVASSLQEHYGLGQEILDSVTRDRLYGSIDQLWQEAAALEALWPFQGLIVGAINTVRAQTYADDFVLQRLDELMIKKERQIRRIKRELRLDKSLELCQ